MGRPLPEPAGRRRGRGLHGLLTRQGSPLLRWALYEAAQSACKPQSPAHSGYLELKARGLSHTRATITIARKLARRCYHSLLSSDPPRSNPSPESFTLPLPIASA